MKRKSIRTKFVAYVTVAVLYSVALAVVSFFVIRKLSDHSGEVGDATLDGYLIFLAVFYALFVFAAAMVVRDMAKISIPIRRVAEQASRIARGYEAERCVHNENNEIGELVDAVNSLSDYLVERTKVLQEMNDGDYGVQMTALGDADHLSLTIQKALDTNNEILHQIKRSAFQITTAANELASGAQMLAGGSNEQAATMEQFTAVISEVESMAARNAEISQETLERAQETRSISSRSVADIDRMTAAMSAITESGRDIEMVIKVIDEIAFQTNILALNAAVEAARAGQHGKGFAVVADEVRVLASKSAAAAQKTSELIQSSARNVSEGAAIVRQTSENVLEMGRIADGAAENMGSIVGSSEQQLQSVLDLKHGINQISTIIQSNSAMAEQSAAAAQSLSSQSETLKRLVARFKLRGD